MADNMHCQLYISSSDGKQYRVVCKEVEKVKGILEKKVHILVQKFLNKWTIFLFCSILFSSNQKEH